jgi:sugar phosphate isomerase/epimerase
MASSRHMALGLAWVVLAAGCGGSGDEPRAPESKLARAERSLQAELEAAVDRLGMTAEPGERVAASRCDDGARQDVTSGYRVRLRIDGGDTEELLRRAAGFWRERGRAVRVVSRTGAFPAVFATADPGWTFALQLFPERGEAVLSGGTPCLPDPEA